MIHDALAFATLCVGDSQTMAAEAGVLGTPFIRFNDFVGRIGYLAELEDIYQLGFGISPNNEELLFQKTKELVETENLKSVIASRRKRMLLEKIDVAKYLTWIIEDYSSSIKTLRENPDYQYNFK